MGMFRIAASLGTMGAVSPRSRQSRDTRALRNEARKQTALLRQIAAASAASRETDPEL